VIEALHSSPIGGHSRFPVTYKKIKQHFAWTGMKKQIHSFMTSCSICQQAKPDRAKYPGLLQCLPLPQNAWQVVTLDFIEGLPRSGEMNAILVMVDKFSKFSHFLPLRHPFTALTVAKVFFSEIYRLHGMPMTIISDRDRIFTSNLWRELFKVVVVWTSLGPLPRWVPGPTTRWAPGTTRLALHGT
jgi:hypothetical protein